MIDKLWKLYVVMAVMATVFLSVSAAAIAYKEIYHNEMTYKEKVVIAKKVFNKLQLYTGEGKIVKKLTIEESDVIDAYANEDYVAVTTAALRFLKNEDEIAAWLGHEIGHIMLGHIVSEFYDAHKDGRIHELNADKYGVYLMMRAGYDICQAKNPWKRLEESEGNDTATKTHPSYADRVNELTFPGC